MKIKKPSLKGMKNCEYLGHFAQDKYIQEGHNLSGSMALAEAIKKAREDMAAGRNTNQPTKFPKASISAPPAQKKKMTIGQAIKKDLDMASKVGKGLSKAGSFIAGAFKKKPKPGEI